MDGDRTGNQAEPQEATASTPDPEADAANGARSTDRLLETLHGPLPATARNLRLPRFWSWWSAVPARARSRRTGNGSGDAPAPPDPAAPNDANYRRAFILVPIVCSALVGLVPVLAGFMAIAFELFPGLQPAEPPSVRGVTLTQVELVERDRFLGPGRYRDIVRFEVEAIGYDENSIAIEWLLLDAATLTRLDDMPESTTLPWNIHFSTRTDRVSGEIEIEPLRSDEPACIIVRVYVRLVDAPEDDGLFLDMADTAPYDPRRPHSGDCAALDP